MLTCKFASPVSQLLRRRSFVLAALLLGVNDETDADADEEHHPAQREEQVAQIPLRDLDALGGQLDAHVGVVVASVERLEGEVAVLDPVDDKVAVCIRHDDRTAGIEAASLVHALLEYRTDRGLKMRKQ